MQSLLTLSEVCQYLKVSHDTIEKAIRDGKLAGIKIGKLWRFTPEAVEAYIKLRTIKVKKAA